MSKPTTEPQWCQSWTSHDDIGGEGEQTFYHECGQPKDHEERHTCMGHHSEWNGEWESCHWTWRGR